jgi:hypothetical protein
MLGVLVTWLAATALLVSLVWGALGYWNARHSTAGPATPAASSPPAAAPAPTGRVRVQVLNATATKGLARVATNVLRDGHFDVVETSNAPRGTPPRSIVIDRVGNLQQARQAATVLGIARVETRRDPALFVEVTVVLGSDWHAPAGAN